MFRISRWYECIEIIRILFNKQVAVRILQTCQIACFRFLFKCAATRKFRPWISVHIFCDDMDGVVTNTNNIIYSMLMTKNYRTVENAADSIRLQTDLDLLVTWSARDCLPINTKKYETITFTCKTNIWSCFPVRNRRANLERGGRSDRLWHNNGWMHMTFQKANQYAVGNAKRSMALLSFLQFCVIM